MQFFCYRAEFIGVQVCAVKLPELQQRWLINTNVPKDTICWIWSGDNRKTCSVVPRLGAHKIISETATLEILEI